MRNFLKWFSPLFWWRRDQEKRRLDEEAAQWAEQWGLLDEYITARLHGYSPEEALEMWDL